MKFKKKNSQSTKNMFSSHVHLLTSIIFIKHQCIVNIISKFNLNQ